jgi:hypothetical protein
MLFCFSFFIEIMSKLELCSGVVLNIGRFYLLGCTKLRLQDAMIVT